MSELSGEELVLKWQDLHEIWHFEGSTKNLTELIGTIGYADRGFGNALEEFLCDNPGAQVAIVEWIAEVVDRNNDWRQALEEEIDDRGSELDEEGS